MTDHEKHPKTERRKAADFPQEILKLFDGYVHGHVERRDFLEGAAKVVGGGAAALGVLEALQPTYAWARQVPIDDERVRQEYVTYDSPDGSGRMRGYLAMPASASEPRPCVLVIHENRGLNPYIEDVVRRFAAADFVALGPDALTPLGGYPGNDDEGRAMQRQLDREVMMRDWMAGFRFLRDHEATTGRIGAVGFCYGGGVVNELAVRMPDMGAGVPFYGAPPALDEVPSIRAPLMIHLAGLDDRVNARYPEYIDALLEHDKEFTVHVYEGANHGFHNDTTPRYDEEAASLAQERTMDFFGRYLRG